MTSPGDTPKIGLIHSKFSPISSNGFVSSPAPASMRTGGTTHYRPSSIVYRPNKQSTHPSGANFRGGQGGHGLPRTTGLGDGWYR